MLRRTQTAVSRVRIPNERKAMGILTGYAVKMRGLSCEVVGRSLFVDAMGKLMTTAYRPPRDTRRIKSELSSAPFGARGQFRLAGNSATCMSQNVSASIHS